MAVIFGSIFVLVAVLLGFSMAGGEMHSLMHLSEFVTIGGASFGALVIMSPKKVLIDLFKGMLQLIKGSPYNRAAYTQLFELLYSLTKTVRRDGMLALDSHVNAPHESALFNKYPRISRNHHALEFLCNGLGMIVDGKADAVKLNEACDEEIKVIEREHHAAVAALTKTADALPGFGIVAAVLGIVVTMGAIDGPASEIGHKVGAALVGTFLGILLSYGFFNPMAGRMEVLGEGETTFFRAMASAILAIAAGESPKDVVIQSRRVVGTDNRPSQKELTQIFKDTAA